MIRLFTAEQMRQADEKTIASGTPSTLLMERAGQAVADEVVALLQKREQKEVLIVCGGGNNGGDGFVAARLLRERNYPVDVVCFSQTFSTECLYQKEKWTGEIYTEFPKKKYVVIVDALFGTGLSRVVEGKYRLAVDYINASGAYILSVDIPSGLNGTDGRIMGVAVRADKTLTLGGYKTGLLLGDGLDCTGEIVLEDIGIDVADTPCAATCYEGTEGLALPRRRRHTHKGHYGKACVVGGSKAYSGAPILSALACLRGGAGYTRLCVPKGLFSSYVGKVPEAVLSAFCGEEEHEYSETDAETLLSESAVAIGMGCGVNRAVYAYIRFLLQNYTGTLVIDADGLNALAAYGLEILGQKKCAVVLTPHLKEFSRLCGYDIRQIQMDRLSVASAFAKRYGVQLLLKDSVSVYTDGKKTILISDGSPCLAKGGSGDVLSGLIVSLSAQGIEDAPLLAARIFGMAGEIAEREKGEYSVIGRDVVEKIPAVILRCAEQSDTKGSE